MYSMETSGDAIFHAGAVMLVTGRLSDYGKEPNILSDFKRYLSETGSFKLPVRLHSIEGKLNRRLEKVSAYIELNKMKKAEKEGNKLANDLFDLGNKMEKSDLELPCEC